MGQAGDSVVELANEGYDTVYADISYVMAANIEREAHAQATTGVSEEDWIRDQEPALGAMAASGTYPAFARLMARFTSDGYDLDLDRIFDLGLHLLLDGFTPLIEQKR